MAPCSFCGRSSNNIVDANLGTKRNLRLCTICAINTPKLSELKWKRDD